MSRINEILSSGRAPGVQCGVAVDPNSVYAKAPKGLRELESGGGRKRSERPIGAREISRQFGMSVDKIKEVWSRPPIAILLAFLLLSGSVFAGDLVTGESFSDGQTVHASDLNNAINGALIQSSFYTRQSISTPATPDYLVAYSANGYLYRATLNSFLSTPFYQSLNSGTPSTTNSDLFVFYSVTGTNLVSITFSNLLTVFSAGINPALFNFAPTNSGGTNVPVLPNWPGTFTGSSTNNQPFSLRWGSNGVPYQLSLSNEEKALAADLGTNWSLPYVFNQVFQPWLVYGTNNNNFTNVWGSQTNFLITSLYLTNAYNPTNPTPTLVDADTIPVNSTGQRTNTDMTLAALGQYMTNAYPYPFGITLAKVNFTGVPLTITTSNLINTNFSSIQVNGSGFVANMPYCVSFSTSGNFYFGGTATNTPYFLVPFATNANWMRIYTNYAYASGQTNWVTLTQSASGTTKLYYLTNYASLNCDPIQTTSGNSAQTGEYDICFRTPAMGTNYYVTGTPQQDGNKGMFFNIDYPSVITTNKVRVVTCEPTGVSGGTANASPNLIHTVIFN